MKSKTGVTLVELMIVIVIITLMATFAVMSGRKTLDQTDASEVYVEMNAVKQALNSVALKQNMDETLTLTQGIHYDAAFTPVSGISYGDNVLGNQSKWYLIFGRDLKEAYESSQVRKNLGLETVNHTYIVNFETNEVELYRPLIILNTSVRTYEEVRSLVSNS